jgi:steroid 5-alpha reductase family enzyme
VYVWLLLIWILWTAVRLLYHSWRRTCPISCPGSKIQLSRSQGDWIPPQISRLVEFFGFQLALTHQLDSAPRAGPYFQFT